eukprot:GFUD01040861.1.p1 GENE.GFUD01040861.1~~GFUD01040861.1.p1  ORF type:complete len:445 (-),score=124.56 GFUD01040861.1:137-1471(-)
MDEDWKIGLTIEQLLKVEELENCLGAASATANLWQKEDIEKSQNESQSGLRNGAIRIHEASSDSGTSPSPRPTILISSSSPTRTPPPPLPTSQPPHNVDTSPSFRSLNPGYVSSLADFWANKWKMENDDSSEACREEHGQGLEENDNIVSEHKHEVKCLRETIMAQCELLRASQEENLKLKQDFKILELQNEDILADLNLKVERSLKKKESTAAQLENLNDGNEKVSVLLKDDKEKNCKISELKEKLERSVEEKEFFVKEFRRLQQDLKGKNLKFEELKEKNGNFRTRFNEYEETVKDLRNQLVPVENLKTKMRSLDQDVKLLRMRLQASVRSSSKCTNKEDKAESMTKMLPIHTSTKRRWSAKDEETASPAKMMKIEETEFMSKKPVEKKASESSDSGQKIALARVEPEAIGLESAKLSNIVSDTSLKAKNKIGQHLEDCKQQ